MVFEIKAPSPGESINEIILNNWYKKDGDRVEENEIIAEMESEKANLEITAEKTGILRIKTTEGDTVTVGETIAIIEEFNTSSADLNKKTTADHHNRENLFSQDNIEEQFSSKTSNKTETNSIAPITQVAKKTAKTAIGINFDVIIPSPGESISEVTIGTWIKKDGDFVEENEDILEIESEKANLSIAAEISGILKVKLEEGKIAKVGDIAAVIVEEEKPAIEAIAKQNPIDVQMLIEKKFVTSQTKAEKVQKQESITSQASQGESIIIASPAAQKIMEEKNIEFTTGSGKDGRITKQDVIARSVSERIKPEKIENNFSNEPVEKNLATRKLKHKLTQLELKDRKIEKQKLSNMRKTIARKLHSATQETAMLTTFNEVNMDAIFQIRKSYKDIFQSSYDVKLGFLSFFVKASCLALLEFPDVNSQIDLKKGEKSLFNYIDMGIAVSAPKGLVVPVLKNAHQLSLANIEKEIILLANKAREGKIKLDEMVGGTFTITNGGIFGSMLSTPILNTPQSAILGMHNVIPRAMVIDGEIKIANMMYLALTYDHRVIDGKSAVSFLVSIKNYLEDPVRMLLGV